MIRDVSGYAAYFTTIFYCQRYFEQIGLSPLVGSFIAGAIVRVFIQTLIKGSNIQVSLKLNVKRVQTYGHLPYQPTHSNQDNRQTLQTSTKIYPT